MTCPICEEIMSDVDEIEGHIIVGHYYECEECQYIERTEIEAGTE